MNDILNRTTAVIKRINVRYDALPDFMYATIPEYAEMRAISDAIKTADIELHAFSCSLSESFVAYGKSFGYTPAMQIQRLILQLGVSVITDNRASAALAYTCVYFDAVLDIINESETQKQ